jgi:DNA-binding transcriptional regulator LsrR (DeoR family)
MISKQQFEAQLQQIFRLLLENKTQEEIAHELNISTRTVARYSQRIDKRYGDMQRQKTDNTLFLEAQLFKHRMLTLYKALETQVTSDKTSGTEKAKCAELAANIATDVLKMESEGIRAVTEGLVLAANSNGVKEGQRVLNNLNLQSKNDKSDSIEKEYDLDRKF